MKAIHDPEGWRITKGKTSFVIMPGTDRHPILPVRIKYDGTIYPLRIGLIKAVKSFEECYSEEQVIEKLLELTT